MGKTAAERGGDWFSRTRDERHRVWRSARHGCWQPWNAGDGLVELNGDGQPVTEDDDRHPEAVISGLVPFFVSLPDFAVSAHGGLYCCVPENITKQPT